MQRCMRFPRLLQPRQIHRGEFADLRGIRRRAPAAGAVWWREVSVRFCSDNDCAEKTEAIKMPRTGAIMVAIKKLSGPRRNGASASQRAFQTKRATLPSHKGGRMKQAFGVLVWILFASSLSAQFLRLDTNFTPQIDGPVRFTSLQSDGKIVIAGYFTNLTGFERPLLARLNADGAIDPTFNAEPSGRTERYVWWLVVTDTHIYLQTYSDGVVRY